MILTELVVYDRISSRQFLLFFLLSLSRFFLILFSFMHRFAIADTLRYVLFVEQTRVIMIFMYKREERKKKETKTC